MTHEQLASLQQNTIVGYLPDGAAYYCKHGGVMASGGVMLRRLDPTSSSTIYRKASVAELLADDWVLVSQPAIQDLPVPVELIDIRL